MKRKHVYKEKVYKGWKVQHLANSEWKASKKELGYDFVNFLYAYSEPKLRKKIDRWESM